MCRGMNRNKERVFFVSRGSLKETRKKPFRMTRNLSLKPGFVFKFGLFYVVLWLRFIEAFRLGVMEHFLILNSHIEVNV